MYWESNATNIMAVTKETLLTICTVQSDLDFNGKYKAMNFSIDNIISKADE